jgi:gliding motility-associated-like protein
MEDKDHIKELFRDKLSGMESSVRPELWSGIASQLGAVAPAAVGVSVLTKVIIGASIAASVAVATYIILDNSTPEPIKEIAKEATSKTIPEQENETIDETVSTVDENTFIVPQQEKTPSPTETHSKNELLKVDGGIKPEDFVNPIVQPEKVVPVLNDPLPIDPPVITTAAPVIDPPVQEMVSPVTKLHLPNVFTPNGDGDNDFLFVKNEGLSDFNMIVLDLNNKVIYQTNDPDFQWNGLDLFGEQVKEGRYVYYITAVDANRQPVNQYSSLFIKTSR